MLTDRIGVKCWRPAPLVLLMLLAYTGVNVVVEYFTAADQSAGCTLDYINGRGRALAQDDPCVIDIIRRMYLRPPSPRHVAYNMTDSVGVHHDPSENGIAGGLLQLNNNRTGGFFVECGALDGELFSNTLYLERAMNWTGILIEANPHNYAQLVTRNRKSWTLPVCLSLEAYPTRVTFLLTDRAEAYHKNQSTNAKCKWCKGVGRVDSPTAKGTRVWEDDATTVDQRITVQCFPLYSILVAVGRTTVDFFSLDVEGHELAVLKTIPWHKVTIQSTLVEWSHVAQGEQGVVDYLMNEPKAARYTANIALETTDNIFHYRDGQKH